MRDPKNQMWAEACAMLKQAEAAAPPVLRALARGRPRARWEPPIDVFETERQLCIIVALPGVAPEAVRVEIEGGTLTIAGVRPLPDRAATPILCDWRFPMGASSAASPSRRRLRLAERELVNGCLVLTFAKL